MHIYFNIEFKLKTTQAEIKFLFVCKNIPEKNTGIFQINLFVPWDCHKTSLEFKRI